MRNSSFVGTNQTYLSTKFYVCPQVIPHFEHSLEYLRESYEITVEALKKEPNEQLKRVLPGLQIDLAHAALEANETELAKLHATETLLKNTDESNDHYGNVIHTANEILGRVALRQNGRALKQAQTGPNKAIDIGGQI